MTPPPATWNPFRVTGTALPPNLLLMCKVLAVAVLATGHFRMLPYPYLPFVPGLDRLAPPHAFQTALQAAAVVAALALLLNRSVRLSALVLGGCLLLGVLSSKLYYGNNKTFTGLMLVLAALSDTDRPPYLVRWQFSLVYFGAALNKLLDPDWQTGLFFDHWAGTRLVHPLYLAARDWLPPLAAGQVVCWGTVVAEFFVAVALFVRRLVPAALWVNALFQVGLLQFTGTTFTLFFYGMQAAALAFVAWPERLQVYGRGPKPRLWHRLDPDGVQDWRPPTDTDSAPTAPLSVRQGDRVYTGLAARCRLLVSSPAFWLTATTLLALAGSATTRRLLVAGGLSLVALSFWPARTDRRGA